MTLRKEQPSETFIPPPDFYNLDSLKDWLNQYIHTPFPGYENLIHRDGTQYTEDEQVQATRDQYFQWVHEYLYDSEILGKISKGLMNRAKLKIPAKT